MFEITQKRDFIVLHAISIILSMKVKKKNNYFTCYSSNLKSIEEICNYFQNTIKGIKSLEYRIWSRSFKKQITYEELVQIQNKMRKIRSISYLFYFYEKFLNF